MKKLIKSFKIFAVLCNGIVVPIFIGYGIFNSHSPGHSLLITSPIIILFLLNAFIWWKNAKDYPYKKTFSLLVLLGNIWFGYFALNLYIAASQNIYQWHLFGFLEISLLIILAILLMNIGAYAWSIKTGKRAKIFVIAVMTLAILSGICLSIWSYQELQRQEYNAAHYVNPGLI